MSTTGSSAWPWWLLIAVLLGAALAVPLVVLRRRRSAWRARLDAATSETSWFARQLISQLERQGSLGEVAGAWQVTQDRVSTLEDTLTGLETTAPADQEAARARDLRDAVRAARTRIDAAVRTGESTLPPTDLTATRYELGGARATLEEALASSEPGRQEAGANEQ